MRDFKESVTAIELRRLAAGDPAEYHAAMRCRMIAPNLISRVHGEGPVGNQLG